MSDNSAIEWTDATWNFLVGCSKVSAGCTNCYAIRSVARMSGNPTFGHRYQGLVTVRQTPLNWTGKVAFIPDALVKPLAWKQPRRIFVNSLSDLFHPDVEDKIIATAFAVMAMASQHTYQILTKRPERMQCVLSDPAFVAAVRQWMDDDYDAIPGGAWEWPLPNVWLGTSTENQATADERIPHLLATPAAVRLLSCEPLLGPVDLTLTTLPNGWQCHPLRVMERRYPNSGSVVGPISWVISGGESGPKARPMDAQWARDLRDQCADSGVAFFHKQNGGRTAKANGRLLDGREWSEFPEPARQLATV